MLRPAGPGILPTADDLIDITEPHPVNRILTDTIFNRKSMDLWLDACIRLVIKSISMYLRAKDLKAF